MAKGLESLPNEIFTGPFWVIQVTTIFRRKYLEERQGKKFMYRILYLHSSNKQKENNGPGCELTKNLCQGLQILINQLEFIISFAKKCTKKKSSSSVIFRLLNQGFMLVCESPGQSAWTEPGLWSCSWVTMCACCHWLCRRLPNKHKQVLQS